MVTLRAAVGWSTVFKQTFFRTRLQIRPTKARNMVTISGQEKAGGGERTATEQQKAEGGERTSAEQQNGREGEARQQRGTLVVMEGCDRTGKTTQARKLVDYLCDNGRPAVFMCFPERSTPIGSIINSYLSQGSDLDDRAIHLLFSANRWELLPQIKSHLNAGTNIIIDRYAFSGVAFTAAKPGLSLEWCKNSDAGLPRPDLVLFLDLTPEQAQARGGYGSERYEKQDFQARVKDNYLKLKDDYWKVVNANHTIEALQELLRAEVMKAVDKEKTQQLPTLW